MSYVLYLLMTLNSGSIETMQTIRHPAAGNDKEKCMEEGRRVKREFTAVKSFLCLKVGVRL